MTLTYSRHQPSGTVLVWQKGEPTAVYADLSGSGGGFDEKVARAREIVEAINASRSSQPAKTDRPWSERPPISEQLEAGYGALGPSPLDSWRKS